MELVLYTNNSELNKVDKDLTEISRLNGTLRAGAKVYNPTIMTQTIPNEVNYVFIPEFGRYYFLKNKTKFRRSLDIIELVEDVLMTYKNELRSCMGLMTYTTGSSDDYLSNNSYVTDVRSEFEKLDFENPFLEKPTYVMITLRGKEK